MQRLHIQLVICIDRPESHLLTINRLSNRFCIQEVDLVSLATCLDPLRRFALAHPQGH